MEQYIDLLTHPFTAQSELGTIGHFSNIDLAVRSARDYSFYQGSLEFPRQERLKVHIFNNWNGSIHDQSYIDSRSDQLNELD